MMEAGAIYVHAFSPVLALTAYKVRFSEAAITRPPPSAGVPLRLDSRNVATGYRQIWLPSVRFSAYKRWPEATYIVFPSTVGLPVGEAVVGCCQRQASGAGPLNCANAEVTESAAPIVSASARILDIMPLLCRGRRTSLSGALGPPASARHATRLSAIHRTS